jgi:hypothetical protein
MAHRAELCCDADVSWELSTVRGIDANICCDQESNRGLGACGRRCCKAGLLAPTPTLVRGTSAKQQGPANVSVNCCRTHHATCVVGATSAAAQDKAGTSLTCIIWPWLSVLQGSNQATLVTQTIADLREMQYKRVLLGSPLVQRCNSRWCLVPAAAAQLC